MSAHAATTTHNCKFPGCTKEARSNVGRYAYCEDHRDRAARGLAAVEPSRAPQTTGGLAKRIAALAADAKAVDRAKAKAAKLADKALAAKREADRLEQALEIKLREATRDA